MIASMLGQSSLIELLIASNASLDLQNREGYPTDRP
jgi:hypothetical protein